MIEAKKSIIDNKFCYQLVSEGITGGRCFYDPTEGEIYDYEYIIELDDISKRLMFLAVIGYLEDIGHKRVVCSCDKDLLILEKLGFKKTVENSFVLDLNGYFSGCSH